MIEALQQGVLLKCQQPQCQLNCEVSRFYSQHSTEAGGTLNDSTKSISMLLG